MTSTIHMARTGTLPPLRRILVRSCRYKCPGGHECNCDGMIEHRLHICNREGCWCHSRERYEREDDKQ